VRKPDPLPEVEQPYYVAPSTTTASATTVCWPAPPARPFSRSPVNSWMLPFCPVPTALNRPGFAGGSNFQIGWSHDEQDDEQVFP
jgi:hypothetical protein